jgi:hypothetical protein
MSHYYALLSIVFMMSFVLLFDIGYLARGNARFVKNCLLSARDIAQLQSILSAFQNG